MKSMYKRLSKIKRPVLIIVDGTENDVWYEKDCASRSRVLYPNGICVYLKDNMTKQLKTYDFKRRLGLDGGTNFIDPNYTTSCFVDSGSRWDAYEKTVFQCNLTQTVRAMKKFDKDNDLTVTTIVKL